MSELAKNRPIFHSEADFQFALSTRIHAEYPGCEVRLEKPFRLGRKTMYVDIWLHEESLAIELKYFTQALSFYSDDESFTLKDHAARDLARYGFLADVQRIEELSQDDSRQVQAGFAVILTNDPGLWETSRRKTNDVDFHIHHGRTAVTGKLSWRKGGVPIEGDEISLRDRYSMEWRPYSDLGISAGEFRYLALDVGGKNRCTEQVRP